jgi:ribose 5-phosphate isomerase B
LKYNSEIYKVAIASDHAGFELKAQLIELLVSAAYKYKVLDCGTNSATKPSDYPDYAKIVCEHLAEESARFGILICSTGIGMSIAANRLLNIRAALCVNEFMAFKARAHNNANILVLGAKIITFETAKEIIKQFFLTQFEGGRHANRIAKIH